MVFDLNDEDTKDLIIGLYAYDTGSVDSGIKDNTKKEELKNWLSEWLSKDKEFYKQFSRYIREEFLSEEALEQGYRLENVASFLKWLDYEMDISF